MLFRSSLVTTTGGTTGGDNTGGDPGGRGGAQTSASGTNNNDGSGGAVATSGRIHAEYSQLLSGTTNPTVDSVQDVIFDDLPLEQNYTLLM